MPHAYEWRRLPLLLLLSIVCGATYFLTSDWRPFPGRLVIKGLSIAMLALYARKQGLPVLALGLAVASLGDMLLDVQGRDLFIPGLVAFLAAHVLFTTHFIRRWDRSLPVRPRDRLLIVAVAVYAIAFTIWLAPDLGPVTIPVAIYICAITAMAISAIVAKSR